MARLIVKCCELVGGTPEAPDCRPNRTLDKAPPCWSTATSAAPARTGAATARSSRPAATSSRCASRWTGRWRRASAASTPAAYVTLHAGEILTQPVGLKAFASRPSDHGRAAGEPVRPLDDRRVLAALREHPFAEHALRARGDLQVGAGGGQRLGVAHAAAAFDREAHDDRAGGDLRGRHVPPARDLDAAGGDGAVGGLRPRRRRRSRRGARAVIVAALMRAIAGDRIARVGGDACVRRRDVRRLGGAYVPMRPVPFNCASSPASPSAPTRAVANAHHTPQTPIATIPHFALVIPRSPPRPTPGDMPRLGSLRASLRPPREPRNAALIHYRPRQQFP